jgi:hypothetical protein
MSGRLHLAVRRPPGTAGTPGLVSSPRALSGAARSRLLAGGRPLQLKLAVGASNDPLEIEADRLAEHAMGAATPVSPAPAAAASEKPGAPASVEQAVAGGGAPLAESLRGEMERRFGHEFSRVRVHTSPAAARSARALDALAYTVGHDVVFAPAQFSPATHAGRHLIAHELAHVLQQTGAQPLPRGHRPGMPGSAGLAARPARLSVQRKGPQKQGAPATMGTIPAGTTRPATAQDRRDFAREAAAFLSGQGEHFALQPDRDLGQLLGLLRSTAESGLAAVANEPSAADAAEAVRTAYRDAVRTLLRSRTQSRPGMVRTPPTLQELYEQNRDAILDFALPQAQADTAADELSAELTAPLPDRPTREQRTRHAAVEAARQQLKVLTSSIDMPIDDLFSTTGGRTTISLPPNTTARFASIIPASLHHGLQNVAAQLADSGGLAANTTVMMALDLTPYGGSYDAYRFTRLDLGRLGQEILIERQGAIGVEGLQAQQRQAMRRRFDGLGFQRGSGFSDEEFDQVLIGLGEIPEVQLHTLGNLRFERQPSDPAHPDAAAHYDQAAHTVRVFDLAYASSMTRFGRAGRVIRFAAHSVIHEVGHALDLSPLRTTAAATETAQSAVLAEFGTGGTGFRIPDPRAPDRARFDELNRAVTSATTAERAARSLSGARWTMGNPSEVTDELARGAAQPAFRQAALRDGGPAGRQMPTNYPHPENVWQEYFAESFALYQASPDLLRRMRPNVFHFMEQQFPR